MNIFQIRYQTSETSGSEGNRIFGIKMLENIGVAGDQNGELYFFKRSEETNQSNIWEIERVNSGVGEITHIEGDEQRLAIGTRSGVHLWDMNQMKIIPSGVPVNIHVAMLCFHFPFVFVIGCNWWNGLKMYDIVTGKLKRDLSELGPLQNIHSNGRFLVLSKTSDRVGGYIHEDEERHPKIPCIIMLDVTELIDLSIKDEELWVQHFSDNPSDQSIIAVSNMTKLVVVTMRRSLTVYDFWKDRDYETQQEAEADIKNNLDRISSQNSRRSGFQVLDTIKSWIHRK